MSNTRGALSKLTAFNRSSAYIWKSRLSWRIATAVFCTILVLQFVILALNIRKEEEILLAEIRETGRSAISSIIQSQKSYFKTPVSNELAKRVISSTLVNGFAVFNTNYLLLSQHGETMKIRVLENDNLSQTYRSVDGATYEVIFRPDDLRHSSYIVVARLNSENVNNQLLDHLIQSIIVMLLLSALVTTVLMIALGHWLLEPILFMRGNLIEAQKNPENPKIPSSPFKENDEIGEAIAIAQNLIKKNAENMQQVRAAAEDKIHKLAYFDQLTGLPNRTLFSQKLTELAFSGSNQEERSLAVITLDLDHFKDINDSMGHSVGDAILRGVAKRLRSSLSEENVVSRIDADEFAVAVPLNKDLKTSRDVGQKVLDIIKSEPYKVYNETFQIRCSVGIATYPNDGKDSNTVLKNADIALNRAKEEGRDRIREYSEDFDKAVQQRFQTLRDLRDALENEDLTVFYQPQFDLKTGDIIGAEALIRWWKKDNSKEGGAYIPPFEFIPIAEQSGLIVPIGLWVLKEACKTAKTWHKEGKNIRIAVNVSGEQFYQSNFLDQTKNILKQTGVKPELLELEVTESVFMDDISIAIETLKQLHELGVELAIDDFGTGYSSLAYLRQFNIDRLKIDQSFIRNALNNTDDAAITRTIINLGHSLNLKVIAEGVETKDHETFLTEHGCDEVQGFRYSKPVPSDEFWDFAKNYNGNFDSFDS